MRRFVSLSTRLPRRSPAMALAAASSSSSSAAAAASLSSSSRRQVSTLGRHRVRRQQHSIIVPAARFSTVTEVVPQLGDSITEGTIVEFTKQVGEAVAVDDIVCVIETDKVSVDIRTKVAGVITAHSVGAGDTVEVGNELFTVDTEGKADPSAAPAAKQEATKPAEPKAAASSPPPPPPPPKPAAAAAAPTAKPAVARSGARTETRQPMSRMRQTIAKRLKEAQNTAACLTTFNEVDMSNLMAMRAKYKDEFEARHGAKLGFMSAFVAASTSALQRNPMVNATIEGQNILYRDFCDVSVAVSTPTGLVVPVLRNTETMSFADIEKAIAEMGKKARAGQITMEDMAGGTFTISNGGVFGSLMGTPIINLPQSAILGMHGIFKRPVAVGDKVEIRPMMYIALTYDHRIIDGSTAVVFLKHIKECVEDPARLVLDL